MKCCICINFKSKSNKIKINVQLSLRVRRIRWKHDEIRLTYTRFVKSFKSSNVLFDWYETRLLRRSNTFEKSSLFDISCIWYRSITINSHVVKHKNLFVYVYRIDEHRIRIHIRIAFEIVFIAYDNTYHVIEYIFLHWRYLRKSQDFRETIQFSRNSFLF